MTTVAIAGIFAAMTVPGIRNLDYNHRQTKQKLKIESVIRQARNEARMRNRCVELRAPNQRWLRVYRYDSCTFNADGSISTTSGATQITELEYKTPIWTRLRFDSIPGSVFFRPNGSVAMPLGDTERFRIRFQRPNDSWTGWTIYKIWEATGAFVPQ